MPYETKVMRSYEAAMCMNECMYKAVGLDVGCAAVVLGRLLGKNRTRVVVDDDLLLSAYLSG